MDASKYLRLESTGCEGFPKNKRKKAVNYFTKKDLL